MPARPAYATPRLLLLVALGGAVGSLLRYAVGRVLPTEGWPWATFTVNVTGALLLGALTAVLVRRPGRRGTAIRMGLGSGLLGSFTTYSALATETVLLGRDGQAWLALGYALASLIAGLAAAAAGLLGAAAVLRRRPVDA